MTAQNVCELRARIKLTFELGLQKYFRSFVEVLPDLDWVLSVFRDFLIV